MPIEYSTIATTSTTWTISSTAGMYGNNYNYQVYQNKYGELMPVFNSNGYPKLQEAEEPEEQALWDLI